MFVRVTLIYKIAVVFMEIFDPEVNALSLAQFAMLVKCSFSEFAMLLNLSLTQFALLLKYSLEQFAKLLKLSLGLFRILICH